MPVGRLDVWLHTRSPARADPERAHLACGDCPTFVFGATPVGAQLALDRHVTSCHRNPEPRP